MTPEDREKQAKLLTHPTRLAIVAIMGKREMSPAQVAEELGVPKKRLGAVAYHFRPMLDLNMLRMTRTDRVRGAVRTFYKIQPTVLKRGRKQLAGLLDDLDKAIGPPPLLDTIFRALATHGWTLDDGTFVDPEGNSYPSLEAAITAQTMREIARAGRERSARQ